MRKIDMIVVHCSGSRCNHRYTLEQLRHDHVVVNGWRDIGYHFYITLEGGLSMPSGGADGCSCLGL